MIIIIIIRWLETHGRNELPLSGQPREERHREDQQVWVTETGVIKTMPRVQDH